MIRLIASLILIFVLQSVECVSGDVRPLEYTISFEDRASHYAHIRLVVPAPTADTFELMMPTWTPGSYLIREYARHVDHVVARSDDSSALALEKSSKNRWLVKCVPGKDVTISYRLYCHEMSVRSNWVDQDMAILNGAATFLTVPGAEKSAHQVHFDLPERWSRTMTALQAVEGRAHTYLADTLDELIDSPVLCGQPIVQDFSAGGVTHVLATLGDSSLWDTAKAAADVQRIVAQQQTFWGVVPYSGYKFLNVISEANGGLEHDNSTLVMTSRWNFRDKDKYEDWLSLISHEFFHTWNVRRLRPADLANYNYEAENNTRSLWVAEGLTSYYEDLMLVRAGLIDHSAYLKRLSKAIEKLQTSPGRNVQTLSESSFDSWIKFYRPDENSSNSRVSYYVKGAVVGFLLDARIRELTSDARSLDDVMRLLYQRHAGPKGFSDAEFAAIVSEVAGTDMNSWLAQHVETTDELDYQPALNWFGLHFPTDEPVATETPSEDSTSPAASTTDAASASPAPKVGNDTKKDVSKKKAAWLGIQTSESGNAVLITGVTHGSPAHTAGLNVDDELLAFNQYRVNAKTWKDQLTQLGIGEKIRVLVARRGEIRTIEAILGTEPKEKWSLKPLPKPSDETKARMTNWLGTSG
jgi:predicted metalloprotease with PDZ domain